MQCNAQTSLAAPANFEIIPIQRDAPANALGVAMSPVQARQSVQWLADQLIRHIPDHFDGDDDWGKTKSVWAGIKLTRDGWKVSTKRRKRDLRHGRWVRYDIKLPAFEKNDAPDGAAGLFAIPTPRPDSPLTIQSVTPATIDNPAGGWRVDAAIHTPAKFHIRVERWNLGMQAFSISVDGTMDVYLDCRFTMGVLADYSEVPPAMQLDVKVEEANLQIQRFNVERISKLGGDVAEELGDVAEDTLIRLWLKKENARLAQRLNDAIAKHDDDLRWSMMQWLGQWQQP